MSEFVHLHVHTLYSILDGFCKINEALEKAKELNMTALAITDHGNMHGAVNFYSAALARSIKPIIGCEVYVDAENSEKLRQNYHLVLLSKNYAGYKNLMKIASYGYLKNFYHKPRVKKSFLKEHSEGLIALSACLNGEVAYHLKNQNIDKARLSAQEYASIFGYENFFIELQHNGIYEQDAVNKELYAVAKEKGIELCATCDVHYVEKEHAKYQDVMMCIKQKKLISDTDRMKYDGDGMYMKSAGEMLDYFHWAEDAVKNTVKIAERCNTVIETGKHYFPKYALPDGCESSQKCLETITAELFETKYEKENETARARLEHELAVIKKLRFANYFLIVYDIVKYAKSSGIFVGPGRGSAAGSIISYILGITNIDPLKYDLLFERFLNPERAAMPDIDIDFEDTRREEVIEYVRNKYGRDKTAQIATFNFLKGKGIIRDAARALGFPFSAGSELAELVTASDFSILSSLGVSPDLKKIYDDERHPHNEIIKIAVSMEGIIKSASMHAAGIVIAPEEITEYAPVFSTEGKTLEHSEKGEHEVRAATQYAKDEVEKIGLLKIDLLGIRNLSIIKEALLNIKQTRGEDIDIEKIDLKDKKTFLMLQKGLTAGVFQVEGSSATELLVNLKPESINDLVAQTAIHRPGPLKSGVASDFILRKNKRVEFEYEHPKLKTILKETYGLIIYQEQIMQIASAMAGFSLSGADDLRKAIGKKNINIMQKTKAKFIKGMTSRKYSARLAEGLYEKIEKFAEYGFNKSHAVAYATISYQMAYLKANYTIEFMCALFSINLKANKNDEKKLLGYYEECARLKISVMPFDINKSFYKFTIESPSQLRCGLGAMKNAGAQNLEDIIKEREEGGAYKDFYDFIERTQELGVNKKTYEALIYSGALDVFKVKRSAMLDSFQNILNHFKDNKNGFAQPALFSEEALKTPPPQIKEEKELHLWEMLAKEKEYTLRYITKHPLAEHAKLIDALATTRIASLKDLKSQQLVCIGGMLQQVSVRIDRKGNRFATFVLEGLKGEIQGICFSGGYEKDIDKIKNNSFVFLIGEIQKAGDMLKIKCLKTVSFKEAFDKLARNYVIKLNLVGFSEEDMLKLKEKLEKYPGNIPARLKEKNDPGVIELPFKINLTIDDIEKLKQEKGVDDISVELKPLRKIASE